MITGGLLVLAANGAGKLSLDAKCAVKEEKAVARKVANKKK